MDMLQAIEEIADSRIQQRGLASQVRVGKVATSSPLAVILYGDPSSVRVPLKLSTYTPAEGDKVLCAYVGGSLICLGKVVAA